MIIELLDIANVERLLSQDSIGSSGHRAGIGFFKFVAEEQPLNFETRKLPMTTECSGHYPLSNGFTMGPHI